MANMQATMSSINQQILPPAQQALQKMNNLEINLQTLTDTLKRDPSVIVRGSAQVDLGPGEKR